MLERRRLLPAACHRKRREHERRKAGEDQLLLAEQVSQNAVLFLCVPGHCWSFIGADLPLIRAWGVRPTAMGFVLIKLRPLADPTNFTLADLHTDTELHSREKRRVRILCKRGNSLRSDAGVHEIIMARAQPQTG
jgi:hypothetical protein